MNMPEDVRAAMLTVIERLGRIDMERLCSEEADVVWEWLYDNPEQAAQPVAA